MDALAGWAEASALGVAARSLPWLYPAANVLHLLGMALLLGGIATLDFGLMRRAGAEAAQAVASVAVPLAAGGLVLALLSGLVLAAADATALVANPVFLPKLVLVAAGIVNAVMFHGGLHRNRADGPAWPTSRHRVQAGLSLLLWAAVVILGRLIAYV